jgi:hypothetical protein
LNYKEMCFLEDFKIHEEKKKGESFKLWY